MSLTDAELRYEIISLLTAETARDQQRRVGASNLSNGCQFCLASNFRGDMRSTPMLDRAWGGRVLGTATHSVLEERARLNEAFQARYPDARIEEHITLGVLGTYGEIGSTPDLVLPRDRHLIDHKGTTMAKLAVMRDFWSTANGGPALFGRSHAVHKAKPLSEAKYAEAIAGAEYKVTGYYKQLSLYGLGLYHLGIPIERMSINWVARDHTMWFDNPTQDGYEDPGKAKGVWIQSFDFDLEYAEAVWDYALQIWNKLESGANPEDFPRHEHCFPCSLDARPAIAAAA